MKAKRAQILAVAAAALLTAEGARADAPVLLQEPVPLVRPPVRHERASSWRTIVIPAPPEAVADTAPRLVAGPRPAARPPGPIVTAALGSPSPPPAAAPPRLLGPGHALDGIASYYWQEQMTASGERFDKRALTAAHRTLPFGTRVRVTHVASGRSVVVRINDRGPFTRGRVIDLSEAAARTLGMTGKGLAHVRIDVVAE